MNGRWIGGWFFWRWAMASTSAGGVEESLLSAHLLLSPHHRHRPGVVLLACGSFNPPTFMHLRMFELARDHLHRKTNYRVLEGVISVVNDAYKKKDLVSADHRLAMVRLALENSKWIRVDDWEAQQTQYCPTVNVLRHIRNISRQRLYARAKPYSLSIAEDDETSSGSLPFKKPRTDRILTHSSTESSGVSSIATDHQPAPIPKLPKSASIDTPIGVTSRTVSRDETQSIRIMLLCGSDLLQSFEEPDLWAPADIEEIVRDFGIVVVTRSGYDPRKVVYESDVLTKYEHNIHYVTEWIANDVSSTKIRRALKRSESVRYLVSDRVLDYIYSNNLYGWCQQERIDILTPSSSLLDSARDTTTTDTTDQLPHCSYHPQYHRPLVEDSDYDNLSPCPCPLTSSFSVPNTSASHLLRSHPIDIQKGLPLDSPSTTPKPTKFPTILDTSTGPIRPTLIKSAIRAGSRPRAVSYHTDLSHPPEQSSSDRTVEIGDSEGKSGLAFGSVSSSTIQQRSLSNLADTQFPIDRNGAKVDMDEGAVSTAVIAKNGQEEIAWHYNPEVTKSMPNLRLRQTPPRHVRIMDKGVCFTTEDRRESNIANNLVIKVKEMKLTISPETTV